MPRAVMSGAAATADWRRYGRTSGTVPVTEIDRSSAARDRSRAVGLAPTRSSRASGRRERTIGHTDSASHSAPCSFGA